MVYKTNFLQALRLMITRGDVLLPANTDAAALFNLLYKKAWVVYAKAPFSGPHIVIKYLGRYTHKVAISNHRIKSINEQEGTVTFDYKDNANGSTQKQMILSGEEFIRRFQQHILPAWFTKIRTYGYLGNRGRQHRINDILKKMKLPLHKEPVSIPLQIYMFENMVLIQSYAPAVKIKLCNW